MTRGRGGLVLHVGALHQTAEVKPCPGGHGEVGGRQAGEVGVDERGEVGLVVEQGRPGGGGAASHRVRLVLREPVARVTAVAAVRA